MTNGLIATPGFIWPIVRSADGALGAFSWGGNGDLTNNGIDDIDGIDGWLDLSNVSQVRLSGKVTNVTGAGATLNIRYSVDGATFANSLTTPDLAFPGDALGWKTTDWMNLTFAGALGNVYIRPWGVGGDEATFGKVFPLYLQFR